MSEEIVVGTLLRTQTRTKNDVFGDVLWEVVSVGLPAPERERKGKMDGVKCKMLGGSGPAARAGYTVIDSVAKIMQDIRVGITTIVPPEKKASIVAYYADKAKDGQRRPATGVVDLG